jgi:regulator of protease activity HflC (stomatin/prohibitin superfamily)
MMLRQAIASGAAGCAIAAVLLALAGLAATLLMARARSRPTAWRIILARRAQDTLLPLLAATAGAIAWHLHPNHPLPPESHTALLGGLLIVCGFPALVAERMLAAIPPSQLPEAPDLARLLLVPTLVLPLAGCLELARAADLPATPWLMTALAALITLLAAEFSLRALGRWFLPASVPAEDVAAVHSLLATILADTITRRRTAAFSVTAPIRSHFGLDFSRSWALSFLRRAIFPAAALTLAFCWGLSGAALIGLDQRGVYERLGAPISVLHPGFHLLLPWPFGRVVRTELGVIHETPLGADTEPAYAAGTLVPAEAAAPASADRLWNRPHPAEADYLVASAGAVPTFQTVSADIRVVWRVGPTDQDALHAVTSVENPDRLVGEQAARLITRIFAASTLDQALGQSQQAMGAKIRRNLADLLTGTGIEILAVVIEAIHPPLGAAAAYHQVQAAQIIAETSISTETGRARASESRAHEQATTLTDKAQAAAAETTEAARADAIRFTADRGANQAGGDAFLLERSFADLAAALAKTPLTILDSRLDAQSGPVLDFRPPTAPRSIGAEDPD